MNGEVTKSSEALENLEEAQASNGKAEKVRVKLPCPYTQEDLPLESKTMKLQERPLIFNCIQYIPLYFL